MRSDACAILSEIVSNAVVHARTAITVAFECEADALAVAVADRSLQVPSAPVQDELAEGGRGLLLVDALANSWGCDIGTDGEGKVVWFRIGC